MIYICIYIAIGLALSLFWHHIFGWPLRVSLVVVWPIEILMIALMILDIVYLFIRRGHRDKNGKFHKLRNMSDDHLRNSVAYGLRIKNLYWWVQVPLMQRELKRREQV